MERIDLDVFHLFGVILGSVAVGDSPTGSLEFPRIGDLIKRTDRDWFLQTQQTIMTSINHCASVIINPVRQ
jgi:hypothetical protein